MNKVMRIVSVGLLLVLTVTVGHYFESLRNELFHKSSANEGTIIASTSTTSEHSDTNSSYSNDNLDIKTSSPFIYKDKVTITIEVVNNSDKQIHVNPLDFTLSNSSGDTVSVSNDTFGDKDYLNATDLGKGQKVQGSLTFRVNGNPKDYKTLNYNGLDGSKSVTVGNVLQ
jgi:hypothetical protein